MISNGVLIKNSSRKLGAVECGYMTLFPSVEYSGKNFCTFCRCLKNSIRILAHTNMLFELIMTANCDDPIKIDEYQCGKHATVY